MWKTVSEGSAMVLHGKASIMEGSGIITFADVPPAGFFLLGWYVNGIGIAENTPLYLAISATTYGLLWPATLTNADVDVTITKAPA